MKEFLAEIAVAILIFGMLSASAQNGAREQAPLDFGVDPVLVEESFARTEAATAEETLPDDVPFPAPLINRG